MVVVCGNSNEKKKKKNGNNNKQNKTKKKLVSLQKRGIRCISGPICSKVGAISTGSIISVRETNWVSSG